MNEYKVDHTITNINFTEWISISMSEWGECRAYIPGNDDEGWENDNDNWRRGGDYKWY